MRDRKASEFIKSWNLHQQKNWRVHACSLCHYRCSFILSSKPQYDSGCYCIIGFIRDATWDEIAKHYNIQTEESVIKQYDDFWKFKPRDPAEMTISESWTIKI